MSLAAPNSPRMSSQTAETVPRRRRGSIRYRIVSRIPDAVVLGEDTESSFRRSLIMSNGSPSIFFTRSVSLILLLLALDRMTGAFEIRKLGVVLGMVFGIEREVDEKPVVAIDLRSAKRLAVDRNQALAVFAGGFGEQLLDPGAEACERRRGQHGDLVAAARRGGAERNSERDRRVLGGRHIGPARTNHAA